MFDPSRVRVNGPLKRYVSGFVAELAGQGYTPPPATLQLRMVTQLCEWLVAEDYSISELTLPV